MRPALALLIATVLLPAELRAEDDELRAGKVIAVQPRPYRLLHELTASAGVLPIDAFYKGFSVGGAYTLHFSDLVAWEALSFHYSGNLDTGLERELEDRWAVAPTGAPEVQYLVGSHLILTPLFGKLSLFNRALLHGATFLSLGGGVVRFTDGFRPQVSVGPGVRLFLGESMSARLDVRNVFTPDLPSGVEYLLHVTLSVSFHVGSRGSAAGAAERREDGFEALDALYGPVPASAPEEARR